ncbi:MAG: 3-hydroxybutyryl-CoA dehydratase [Frankiales bacterium]|nr:3-hydroxybutyryl-CoA dehydratase [Frankiales bacterium]
MPDTPSHQISLTQDGYVARLRFRSDHPANVFTLPMFEELRTALRTLPSSDARVLVVEGGDATFSGGADLAGIKGMDLATYRAYVETEYEVFRLLEVLPLVTIAALPVGACVGNAAEVALACDFRIAGSGLRIGWPEVNVGFAPPVQRIARIVGLAQAKELVIGGRLIKAERALALGLLTSVVEPDAVAAAVDQLAATHAERPPVAVRLAKAAVERAYPFPADNFRLEVEAAVQSFLTDDFQEGAGAVLERRTPVFAGR